MTEFCGAGTWELGVRVVGQGGGVRVADEVKCDSWGQLMKCLVW